MVRKIQWGKLILSILIALSVGFLTSLLTKNNMHIYASLNKPPLAPAGMVFPIVWTVLYILMGVSAYMVLVKNDTMKKGALVVYALQLAINFSWPLIFFNTELYFLALLILIILWLMVFVMIVAFLQVDPKAAWLQYPYLVWITYATYLNLGVVFLNI